MLRLAITASLCSLLVAISFATTPNITRHPTSAAVGAGVPVTFVASASQGSTFQWFHNGSPIADATNSTLTITNTTFADAGQYLLSASNSSGATNTTPATLTIVPPVQLRHLASVPTSGMQAMWVRVVGNLAYVADSYLQIYNVTDPANPVHVSTYGTSSSRIFSVFVTNNLAYATDGSSLEIIDVSNPSQPTRAGRTSLINSGTDVMVRGNIAYVTSLSGLEIFDVATPATPLRLGEFRPNANIFTIDLLGNAAYLGATGSGLQVVDVSDPMNPTLRQSFNIGFTDSVKVTGDRIYTAGSSFGIFDVREPLNIAQIIPARPSALSASQGLTARGDFLFTGNKSGILNARPFFSVFDLGNPYQFLEVARVTFSSNSVAESFDLVGNHLYLTVGRYLSIYEWEPSTNYPFVLHSIGDALSVAGTSAKLQAHATGGEPLSYLWFKDGEPGPIPGATNRALTLSSLTATDAGTYAVWISNSYGTVTNVGSLQITNAFSFNSEIYLGDSRGPRLTFSLPAGLQTRVQATSDLTSWTNIWQTQSDGAVTNIFDTPGRGAINRFYRLNYGLE